VSGPARARELAAAPPHDLDAEMAVIGAFLAGVPLADAAPLEAGHFYRPQHQVIFEAIAALDGAGNPHDPIAAGDELRRRRQLTKVGGGPYLHTLMAACPAPAQAGYYARIVREHAWRRGVGERSRRVAQAADDPETDVHGPLADLTAFGHSDTSPGSVRGSLLAGVRDGAWLGAQEFAPLRYHVPGIVPEGVTVLAGAPKVGKSWLVLGCGLAVAGAGAALGRLWCGNARPVLYLALEDGDRRMQERCRILLDGEYRPGGSGEIPGAFSYLTRVGPGTITATVAEYLGAHGCQEPLVIVDTLGRVLPPAEYGETAYGRDYRVMTGLKDLADAWPGTSLLISHHDRKADTPDFVESVSGTNGITGGADTVLVLTRPRGEGAGLLHVTGRDVTEGSYAVSFGRGAWTLDGDGLEQAAASARGRQATSGLGERSGEIIAFVIGRGEPVTPAQVGEALGLDGDQAGQYLRRAVKLGRLSKTGRGLYTTPGGVSECPNDDGGNTASEVSECPNDAGASQDEPGASDRGWPEGTIGAEANEPEPGTGDGWEPPF
jgi:hypothetical protein